MKHGMARHRNQVIDLLLTPLLRPDPRAECISYRSIVSRITGGKDALYRGESGGETSSRSRTGEIRQARLQ